MWPEHGAVNTEQNAFTEK